MKKTIASLLFLPVLFFACSHKATNRFAESGDGAIEALHYAKGFRIDRHEGYTRVSVVNPWDTTQLLHEYLLISGSSTAVVPDIGNATLIYVPLRSLAVTGAVHAGMLELLSASSLVTGVAESQYMSAPFVQTGVTAGTIVDLGRSSELNIEKLAELSPDAVFVTTFPQAGHGRLAKTDIPVIECVEYMENTPLGRAEWIKFIGLFVGKSREADSLYQQIEQEYLNAKALRYSCSIC